MTKVAALPLEERSLVERLQRERRVLLCLWQTQSVYTWGVNQSQSSRFEFSLAAINSA